MFFAVVFPVLLVAVIPAVNGGGDQLMADGRSLGSLFAATMAVYGAAVTAYVFMPSGLAEARERLVLKRLRGTPLPAWALLVGRVAGAAVIALATLVLAYVWPRLLYGVGVPPRWPLALAAAACSVWCAWRWWGSRWPRSPQARSRRSGSPWARCCPWRSSPTSSSSA